ncbi:unnamed protein product [Caenorhabditis bovis]|uniref:Cytochrome P450 n=1 Tax=Caenorhabditis bovis TaxID=2654633 RepID=A0A8S1EB64_9PELO|nr:unnamed protein product [Caenorhabditis bovis]
MSGELLQKFLASIEHEDGIRKKEKKAKSKSAVMKSNVKSLLQAASKGQVELSPEENYIIAKPSTSRGDYIDDRLASKGYSLIEQVRDFKPRDLKKRNLKYVKYQETRKLDPKKGRTLVEEHLKKKADLRSLRKSKKQLVGLKEPKRNAKTGKKKSKKSGSVFSDADFAAISKAPKRLEEWVREYVMAPDSNGALAVWVGPVPIVFLCAQEVIQLLLESTENITKPVQYGKIMEWIRTVLQRYQETFAQQGKVLVELLARKTGQPEPFNIFPYIKRCALDIICETAMGAVVNSQIGSNNEYVDAVGRISELIWNYERLPWLWLKPIWYGTGLGFEFDRLVKLTNDFTRKVIVRRKADFDEKIFDNAYNDDDDQEYGRTKKLAFLDFLLKMQKEGKLNDEDIREEVDTFMFEGHDTTASGMVFTLWWLGQYPEYQQKVHDEMDNIFGDDYERMPTNEDVKQMVYLEKCIKEALRLFPSVPIIARKLTEDLILPHPTYGSVRLPAGMTVGASPLACARDPREYERPEEFFPDHFDAERVARRNPYSYVPFAAGPRNCIGQKFAILEEKTVLSWIFRYFRVRSKEHWPDGRTVPELILRPYDGVKMIILVSLVIGYAIYLVVVYCGKILELWKLSRRCSTNLKKIRGPPHIPLIGSAHLFKWDSYEFTFQMEKWAQEFIFSKAKWGETKAADGLIDGIMTLWVGPVPVVFLGTPETIRPVLESNSNISKPSEYDKLREWLGTGLLTSTHEKWFKRRKMLTPTFHFSIIQDYFPVFVAQGEILMNLLEKQADGDYFDAFPYFKKCTLDIICETAMGIQVNAQYGQNNEYVEAVKRISEIFWIHARFPWYWLKPVWYLSGLGFEFDRNVKLTNDFTRRVIAERKELRNETHEDGRKKHRAFLDLLLEMQLDKHLLTDEDIREEVDTFMFEGHDTTASGIGFTVLFLGFYPEAQKKLHAEMDAIFGDSDRTPTMDDMKKCVYLEKCIKESLRMLPSVPLIARKLSEDVTIEHPSGEKIVLPEGLTACVSPIAPARDPRAWKDPGTYNPDNFDIDAISARDPFAYIPFSAGPRNCIGQKFAILEEKTVLSWFFRKFEVQSLDTEENLRPLPELILRPSNGIRIKIKRRHQD